MAAAITLDEIRPTGAPDFAALERATAELDPPFAVVDLNALRRNALDLVRRASGTPIRLASKSVRCRSLTTAVLALPGYQGVLALTLAEALWLATDVDGDGGVRDVVVAYPSADRGALRRLAADAALAERVTLMIDSVEHLEFLTSVVGTGGHHLRICLDLDASLRLAGGRVHLGVRRSPLHTAAEAVTLAREVVRRPGLRLVGLMAYEAQIAGVGDDAAASMLRKNAIRAMQRRSVPELRDRRAAVVAAVREVAPLEFVNGGGTGSLESTSSEPAVTEVAAGSGLYGPALFDTYRHFQPVPAAFFALSVVRRPSAAVATVGGGGWTASGTPGFDRLPTPVWPPGLHLTAPEGAGEAQTPLFGPGAAALRIGDRVWFRHTKAGELCEHVDDLHLIDGDRIVASVPTYRGDGFAFL
ncbi:amino acid deaminase/aldolase [uncultured Jatrophihabitans sp.]|uniref:amino acid deaminase/aldolase n=1 Tax=uncultured Jatrophihabitans sp. TaxID=1610747 RepID=UPI0035CB5820